MIRSRRFLRIKFQNFSQDVIFYLSFLIKTYTFGCVRDRMQKNYSQFQIRANELLLLIIILNWQIFLWLES